MNGVITSVPREYAMTPQAMASRIRHLEYCLAMRTKLIRDLSDLLDQWADYGRADGRTKDKAGQALARRELLAATRKILS